MSGVYEGYHREWRPDPDWRYGSRYQKCRIRDCDQSPIADLRRYSFKMHRDMWWAYCENHLYGRKIENGQVLHSILVQDEPK